MPRISVLMPVYNGLAYIAEAIESVLIQNCDWELVISDNSSTDGTIEYLDTLTDPRIVVFKQRENLGVYGNLNFLLTKASAPIAKILCADDTLLPNSLERVATFMEGRPHSAVSRCLGSGDLKHFQKGGVRELENLLPSHLEPAAAVLTFATCGNQVGNLSQAACRPELILRCGGFDVNFPYAGDYEGWSRVARRFGLDLQNEELIFERSHPGQFRYLLNKSYESIPQVNKVIASLADNVSPSDLPLLKRHWTVNIFSQRTSPFVREIASGRLNVALKLLDNLPLGISPLACILAYPLWKLRLRPAQAIIVKLFQRISELNGSAA